MKHRVVQYAAVLLAASLGGCKSLSDYHPAISGEYTLSSVNEKPLPCCALPDSATGARVTVLSGTLTLGDAAPEPFVFTPAGEYPSSCVHGVPNGATVKDSDFPRCGDGDFALTLNERLDYPDGSSTTTTVSSSGRYAWSDETGMIKLVDVPMLGSVALTANGAEVSIQRVTFQGTFGPTYTFRIAH
jgi:hypothetical protein